MNRWFYVSGFAVRDFCLLRHSSAYAFVWLFIHLFRSIYRWCRLCLLCSHKRLFIFRISYRINRSQSYGWFSPYSPLSSARCFCADFYVLVHMLGCPLGRSFVLLLVWLPSATYINSKVRSIKTPNGPKPLGFNINNGNLKAFELFHRTGST